MPTFPRLLRRPSKNPLANYSHYKADNVGDRACGAAQYFWPDGFEALSFNDGLTSARTVIFGGGQVFSQTDSFSARINAKFPSSILVAWGIGLPMKWRKDDIVRRVANQFSLFSTRNFEWHKEVEFVPCASCMSSVFDEAPTPRHEVVIYSHRKKTPHLKPVGDVPYMTNAASSLKEAVDFLASGETIVTSSYHGAYWGQLLGRRVICIPYNDKFRTLEHLPVYAEAESWQQHMGQTIVVSGLLEEYRQLNIEFSKKVQDIMDEVDR